MSILSGLSGSLLGSKLGEALQTGSRKAYKELMVLCLITLVITIPVIVWDIYFQNVALSTSAKISSVVEIEKRDGQKYCSPVLSYKTKKEEQREQRKYDKYPLDNCPFKMGDIVGIVYDPSVNFAMIGTKETYRQNGRLGIFALVLFSTLGFGGILYFTIVYKKGVNKLSRKVIVIIWLLILSGVCFFLYWGSGFGKCSIGQFVYFEGFANETCAKMNTKMFPNMPHRYLKVVESSWSDWSGQQPVDIIDFVEIKSDGQVIPLKEGEYLLMITKVNNDEIEVEVNDLGLKKGANLQKEEIDLTACQFNHFKIRRQETVELYTCHNGFEHRIWKITYQ